ncbi:hypothetical protein EWI61_14595 [Methylolobus aquaticus]|nr:hypothetical protein EWI61_14595 [Methylolobus aquaticus]
MTRLILNRPHTHAGRTYAPGDALEVDLPTADWLIGQGIAHPEPEPLPADFPTEPKPSTRKDPKP